MLENFYGEATHRLEYLTLTPELEPDETIHRLDDEKLVEMKEKISERLFGYNRLVEVVRLGAVGARCEYERREAYECLSERHGRYDFDKHNEMFNSQGMSLAEITEADAGTCQRLLLTNLHLLKGKELVVNINRN